MLARAYGLPPTRAPGSPGAPGAPGSLSTNPIETRAARVADTASVSGVRAPEVAARITSVDSAANVSRLVAAAVPGRVSFDGDGASLSAPGSYTLHGRPADRNAAAVAVQTGRSIDISG